MVLKRTGVWVGRDFLSPLTTDSAGQLDVLGHDGDTLSVDGAQVGVLKETDQVSLAGFLQGHDGRALEAQVSLEVLGNFSHQTLEREFADKELSALLVTSDLSQGDGTGPVSVGLLDATCGRGRLPGSLGGKLLTGSLTSGGFTGGLLCTCHFRILVTGLVTANLPSGAIFIDQYLVGLIGRFRNDLTFYSQSPIGNLTDALGQGHRAKFCHKT